jgi:hypothetical protein
MLVKPGKLFVHERSEKSQGADPWMKDDKGGKSSIIEKSFLGRPANRVFRAIINIRTAPCPTPKTPRPPAHYPEVEM